MKLANSSPRKNYGHQACSSELKKTKRQQLKGKTISALFHTFFTFFTLFHTFSKFSSRTFLKKLRLFIEENIKKRTKPFCTLVVARLSSSNFCKKTSMETTNLMAF